MGAARLLEGEWHRELSARTGSVLASVPGLSGAPGAGAGGFQVAESPTPYWLLLPVCLEQVWSAERSVDRPERTVADLLWGQYALFLYVRIQDDLLDRHREDLQLLLVADRFLLESLESFQRCHALDGAFWDFYRRCLRETVDGILEVRRLEDEPGRFTAEHLNLHARVSAIFKLGAAAVCRLYGRAEEMRWLSGLFDRLAVYSQVCDDLQDVAPDLEVGRFTWVANTLLGAKAGESISQGERASRLGKALIQPARVAAVLEELRRIVTAAAALVPTSAPRAVLDLVRGLHAEPDRLEQSLHEARVRWVFGMG